MKDLSANVQVVWAKTTRDDKREAFIEMVLASDAKQETKDKAIKEVSRLRSADQVDTFAANYMMRGEGNGVL